MQPHGTSVAAERNGQSSKRPLDRRNRKDPLSLSIRMRQDQPVADPVIVPHEYIRRRGDARLSSVVRWYVRPAFVAESSQYHAS